MTRVDFHTNVPDKLAYVCRLVRKALARDMRCVVLTEDEAQRAELDRALWGFSPLDFLPHVGAGSELAEVTPVILTSDAGAPLPHHQVLVNLTRATPPHFARFERLFEIVASDEEDAKAGRERYVFYKQRGYPLTHSVAETAA